MLLHVPLEGVRQNVDRDVHSDFGMGGDWSPPIGGGLKGGDKGPMGGDLRVIRDKSGSDLIML